MLISDYFELYPYMFVLFMSILGLMVGSFLNVVIYRLPVMMEREWRLQCQSLFGIPGDSNNKPDELFNLVSPRSRCPHCHNLITAINNIPVISYLFLKGKCKHCNSRISPRYPVVELLTGILTGFVAWHFGYSLQTFFALIFTWSLICLSMIDFDHHLLPDDITLPVLWLGLACNIFNMFTNIHSSLIGAIVGYGILWIIFISFKLLTGKEGMGYGDFKLLALLGAWLGWELLPLIILLSSLLGALIGVTLIIIGRQGRDKPIPFGPYLAIAGWIALIWGRDITDIYLKFV
jgi:leader peptidase (prepilin peptidase)/N-methyltransferase